MIESKHTGRYLERSYKIFLRMADYLCDLSGFDRIQAMSLLMIYFREKIYEEKDKKNDELAEAKRDVQKVHRSARQQNGKRQTALNRNCCVDKP